MELFGVAIIATSLAVVASGLVGYLAVRRRREHRDAATLARAEELSLDIPPSLHPVIDPDICIGSLACVSACPEGEILGLVSGKAVLVTASNCIGHGRCAAECPVGAISLVFGTSKRGVDLPELDTHFETSRPGVHIVGELGGMGLIKNAVTQGLELAEELAKRRIAGPDELVDVCIVGAGPAGLATAVGCTHAGLSFRVLEQESMGGTVAQYPRHKVVMTEPVELPGFGRFGKRSISKEELLAMWQAVIAKVGVRVDERVRVTGIEGEDGAFVVKTTAGDVKARKVVLAMGRRGTPRKLEVPGEELDKVTYRLIEPEQYAGRRVLVVGGGDSALEAALMLAEEPGTEVSISYRNPAFGRCRPENLRRMEEGVASGKVRALMGSQVRRIERERVILEMGAREFVLDNDYVLVCIGGILPTEFLGACGIHIDRHFGEAPIKQKRRDRLTRAHARATGVQPGGNGLAIALVVVGLVIVAVLAWRGWTYYPLPRRPRLDHPLHELLRPAGPWGHGVGVVATGVMLLNFLYAVRKRVRLLGRLGTLRTWLTFHTFVGVMSPVVIAFHAAFQSNNLLATATAGSLAVVVGTGLFGRYLFSWVPTAGGRLMPIAQVEERWRTLLAELDAQCASHAAMQRIAVELRAPPRLGGSLAWLLLRGPVDRLRASMRARAVRHLFARREDFESFRSAYVGVTRARDQLAFYGRLKRFLTVWRAFHVVLSLFLVLVMGAHIALSLYLGYGWILF